MMKKCRNRLASMLLALVMVFAMAVPAFAADAAKTVTVTVTLQTADSSGTITNVSQLTNVKYVTRVPLSVTVDPGATVMEVVNALEEKYAVLTGVEWKEVDIFDLGPDYTPTGEKGQVLQSLTYSGTPYTNVSTITGDSQHGTYTGTAWEYFVDGDYVDLYMNQQTVTSNTAIVLSYDTSSFSW